MKSCNCGSCGAGSTAVLEHEEQSCGCGHEQDHTHEQDHDQDGGCGCSHEHGERELSTMKQDIAAIAIAVVVAGSALLLADGIIQAGLLLAAILVVGLPIFREGLRSIGRLRFEEMALMTIAVVAACLIGEFFEALLVTLLFRIGQLLEDVAVGRGRKAVEAVTRILPENANLLLEDGTTQVVEASTLQMGSRIVVKAGERLPVDAVVLSGSSSVDASSLTGESVAREVEPGDAVLSGMINLSGVLTCETTSGFSDSTASRIIEMVRDSAAQKGRSEKMISRFAGIYTPIVIVLAVLVAVVPPLLGFGPFTTWLSRALVFLVASCPCALVISVPLSWFAGVGAASRQGILIKGTRFMETLAEAQTVVFDKTGTLTTGKLEVSEVYAAPGEDRDEVLRLAAALEGYSNHPIARAVTAAWTGAQEDALEHVEELTALGMRATLSGERLLCGSARLMQREGLDLGGLPPANVYLARGNKVIGAVAVFDNPRAEAAEAVKQLGELGVGTTAMLTGDSEEAARGVQRLTGIGEVAANLLPGDKVEQMKKIRESAGGPALFVGDGINDSPVLAAADAGIAVGLAADAAMEAADVVLLSDKLTSLPQAIRISRRTRRLAKTNIVFALGVKLVVFALAFLGMASMGMAVFADVGVTILSVLNATRALRFR